MIKQIAQIAQIALILIGIIISVFLVQDLELILFDIENFVVLSIIFVGILIIGFLIISGFKNNKDAPHALGLPAGSVRAILALTLIILFVLVAIYFYSDSANKHKPDLAKNILTILGTLVIAVSSFYFGIKATEQGSNIAQKIFDNSNKPQENNNISPLIIQEAISKNKENWIKEYNCIDIKIGKKETEKTQFELNCIVFFVNKKEAQLEHSKEIPSIITYNSEGKVYNIPTDVKIKKEEEIPFKTLNLDIIEEFITEKKEELIEIYRVETVIAALKIKKGQTEKTPCVQFIVQDKFDLPSDSIVIPEFFLYEDYKIFTDVKEENEPTADSAKVCPGYSVYRDGSSANRGTLGLKVYREVNGKRIDYLLSCYHVFCYPELKKGYTSYTENENSKIIAQVENSQIEIASVVEGELNSKLDAALSKIKDDIIINPKLKSYPSTPKYGIRIITNRDVEQQTKVFSYGAITKSISGHVLARKIDRNITFYGKKYYFQNVIPVSKISVSGDSGAMVADEKGKVIGIVFASSSTQTYVIPISEIIHQFKIKIHHV